MNDRNLSALDIYMNRAFKLVIILIPFIALCAGGTFSVIKLLGFYSEVSLTALLLFDASCMCYFVIGILFLRFCNDKSGFLKQKMVKRGKIFICLVEFIQWNFISYMIPSRNFWAYAVFFVLLTVLFLDHRFVAIIIGEISVCLVLSWCIRPEALLPEKNEYFVAEMILRCVFLLFSFVIMWLITLAAEKYLVSELEKIADYDSLTTLRNRRYFNKTIDRVLEKTKKNGKTVTVLMCDLDDFKAINDTYGHDCGDRVLRNVASILSDNVSGNGVAIRFGGEEMLAVIEDREENALKIAEKIRKEVEDSAVPYEGGEVRVTLTMGVATYCGNDESVEKLIKRADSNMYYGKKHGKNRVVSQQ